MSLAAICRYLSANARTLGGVAYAPDAPPDQINDWPAVVVYPASGTHRPYTFGEPPTSLGTHTLILKVMVPAKDDTVDYARLEPFYDAVPRFLLRAYHRDGWNDLITKLGDEASAPIRYELGDEQWGSMDVRAITFTVDVQVQEDIIT